MQGGNSRNNALGAPASQSLSMHVQMAHHHKNQLINSNNQKSLSIGSNAFNGQASSGSHAL